MRSCGNHMGAMSQGIPKISILDMTSQIINLKLKPHFPETNELTYREHALCCCWALANTAASASIRRLVKRLTKLDNWNKNQSVSKKHYNLMNDFMFLTNKPNKNDVITLWPNFVLMHNLGLECCQPHRMGRGEHPYLKMYMECWFIVNRTLRKKFQYNGC